jgi:hypothetical protein
MDRGITGLKMEVIGLKMEVTGLKIEEVTGLNTENETK